MIPVLGLLTSRLAGPLASAAAILLLGLAVTQCQGKVSAERRADRAEKHLAAAQRDLGTCRANTAALEGSISRQNAAVAAWEAEGQARAAEVQKARLAARKEADRAARAAAMLARVSPAGNDVCSRMLAVDAAVKEIAG